MFVQFQSIKIHWESFYGRPYGVFWGTSPCTSAECASGCCRVQCSPMSVRSSGLIMLFKSFISLYPFCLDVLSIIESSILKSLTVIVELSVSLFSSVRTHSVAETPPPHDILVGFAVLTSADDAAAGVTHGGAFLAGENPAVAPPWCLVSRAPALSASQAAATWNFSHSLCFRTTVSRGGPHGQPSRLGIGLRAHHCLAMFGQTLSEDQWPGL